MKKLLIFLILIIANTSLTSCQDLNRSMTRKQYYVPDSLFSFFPKSDTLFSGLHLKTTIGTPKSFDPESMCMFGVYFLSEYYSCNDSLRKLNLIKYYSNTAIRSFKADDKDNYFIIGDEYELLKKYDTSFLKKTYEEIHDCSFLLPHFSEFETQMQILYDTTNICSLPNTYEIYVIKAGNYNNEGKNEWRLLPAKIKHGYSSGVAIDIKSSIIIYWSLVW